LSSARSLHEAE
jgi:hypothetical protein